jgi:pyridinium-3,5-bisthiocarboxylic acid mononucleotide nickel chelatase
MRIAYVHGYEGVTGPLLLGACLDAGASLTSVEQVWHHLRLPAAEVSCARVSCADALATHVTWTAPHAHAFLHAHSYATLIGLLEQSEASSYVKQRVLLLLRHFVAAVARVHGVTEGGELALQSAFLPEILYLGSGVASALEELAIEQVIAAPMPLSTGFIDDAQGRRPLPHPLTAELCRDLPVSGEGVPRHAEQTTVGGAALLTAWATRFGPLPDMTVVGTGYGRTAASAAETAHRLQVLLGETVGPAAAERIAVIEANIDDMNPEFYECVAERLFAQGALDVTLTPLFMKKNRPANTLTVLAPLHAVATLSHLILQETSTFGVRVHEVWRHKLERFHRQVDTRYGIIPVKCGVLDGRIVQAAPEYEACKRLALEQGVPVRLVYAEAASLAAPWLS